MHSTVYCAMLALPIIGWNAIGHFTTSNGLQPKDNKVSQISDFVTAVRIVEPNLTQFQISARDDRIKDCLRWGNCKN